jgi:hypothetical protein
MLPSAQQLDVPSLAPSPQLPAWPPQAGPWAELVPQGWGPHHLQLLCLANHSRQYNAKHSSQQSPSKTQPTRAR